MKWNNIKIIFLLFLFIGGSILIYNSYYGKKECYIDADCKLIYSNCDCEAVPLSDARTDIKGGAVCKRNICSGENWSAICLRNKCDKKK